MPDMSRPDTLRPDTPRRDGHVVIVGASHAGVQAAQSLRQGGWTGPVTLISAEDRLPYQRPDLSKAFLTEDRPDAPPLKGLPFYASNDIALKLNCRVTAIDRARRQLSTETGETLSYDRLILATGATPRRLSAAAENIHVLRDLTDARTLRAALRPGQRIAVIGGGFIGLEVAAAARKAGAEVELFEAAPRCLARALPAIVTDVLLARHRAGGVKLHLDCGPVTPILDGTRARALRLADGREIRCDAVVAGIGCTAETGLAQTAGLALAAGGIAVGAGLVTSDPAIQAIGDCAAFTPPGASAPMRLESVQNATDQGRHAAAVLLGATTPFDAVPWFWSHQYDLRLQMAGFPCPDAPALVRGTPGEAGFSVLHLDAANRLVSAVSLNAAADHMAARRLIAAGVPLDPARAVDPGQPLLGAQSDAA